MKCPYCDRDKIEVKKRRLVSHMMTITEHYGSMGETRVIQSVCPASGYRVFVQLKDQEIEQLEMKFS